MTTKLTNKNHKAQLTQLVTSVTGLNLRIQEFVGFGVEHYTNEANKGNASYLTDLITSLNDSKASMANTVKKYIQAHTNLQYTDKDGVLAFRKVGKKSVPEASDLSVTWFDWSAKSNKATPEIGIISQVNSLADRIINGLADGKAFKAFTEKDLQDAVNSFTKAMKAAKVELLDTEAQQPEKLITQQ